MSERGDTATMGQVYRAIGELEKLVNSKFDTVTEQLKPLQHVTDDVEDLKIRMVAAELHQRSQGHRVKAIEDDRAERARQARQWWRQHAPGLALGGCALCVSVVSALH
jgi:hypothetical protein